MYASLMNNPAAPILNSPFLDLPSRDIIIINGKEHSKDKIIDNINNIITETGITPSEISTQGIYIHGSNSSSIRSVINDEGLLSARKLHQNNIPVEGGEHTKPEFEFQYDDEGKGHNVVFLTKFNGLLNDEVATFMSYNNNDIRYPVLYVISGKNITIREEDISNHTIDRVPSENIIGLLVPQEKIAETRLLLPEARQYIVHPLSE